MVDTRRNRPDPPTRPGRRRRAAARALVCVPALWLAACGGGPAGDPAPADAPDASRGAPPAGSARTLEIPGAEPAGPGDGLPPGHPPLSPEATAGAPGGGTLEWAVPEDWKVEPPSSSMRQAQYRVPGPGGDGECVVYYFGPGQGGDPQANAVRWAGQFSQPDGRDSVDVMQSSRLESADPPVLLVEVTGTYDGGMTMTAEPARKLPGYMLLGAIVEGPDGPWFFKFTGPAATLRAQRAAYERMLRSIEPAG